MNKHYLTKERLEELKKELEDLKFVKRIEVADHLKRAKEYGDLSENSEYVEAKEEQLKVESRIFELEEMLKKAVIIEKSSGGSTVQVGSHVRMLRGKEAFEYLIVGSNEANPAEGKISNESPIGRALLGKKVGEKVEVVTPAGGKVVYEVTKIE